MEMSLVSLCDAGPMPSFLLCDAQCLSSVQRAETFSRKTANSSSWKSRWFFWEKNTAGPHRRDKGVGRATFCAEHSLTQIPPLNTVANVRKS